jgi:hypothetical protein
VITSPETFGRPAHTPIANLRYQSEKDFKDGTATGPARIRIEGRDCSPGCLRYQIVQTKEIEVALDHPAADWNRWDLSHSHEDYQDDGTILEFVPIFLPEHEDIERLEQILDL